MFHPPACFIHPYYTFFKCKVEKGSTILYNIIGFLENVIFLLCNLSLWSIQLAIYQENRQLAVDPFARYIANRRHLYDFYMVSSFGCLSAWMFISNCKLFLSNSKSAISWQAVAYDLLVRNVDQAKHCQIAAGKLTFRRIQRSTVWRAKVGPVVYSLFRQVFTALSNVTSIIALDHLDRDKFMHHHLSIFPFFSMKLRAKLLQLQLLADWLSWAIQCSIFPFVLFGLTSYFIIEILGSFPNIGPQAMSKFMFDLCLLWFFLLLVLRNALLLFALVTITSFSYQRHFKAIHSFLGNFVFKYSHIPKGKASVPFLKLLLLKNALFEHTRLCQIIDVSNRQLISFIVFLTITTNALTNIYFLWRLLYRVLPLFEFAMTLLLIVGQQVFLSFILVPLAFANSALNQTVKYLPALQFTVFAGRANLTLKLKYETFYSCLAESRTVQSGASFGPVCLITFHALYKTATLYAVYLLCFFSLLPK